MELLCYGLLCSVVLDTSVASCSFVPSPCSWDSNCSHSSVDQKPSRFRSSISGNMDNVMIGGTQSKSKCEASPRSSWKSQQLRACKGLLNFLHFHNRFLHILHPVETEKICIGATQISKKVKWLLFGCTIVLPVKAFHYSYLLVGVSYASRFHFDALHSKCGELSGSAQSGMDRDQVTCLFGAHHHG